MSYLNAIRIAQNTGLILNLQKEVNEISGGSGINYQPQIDDLSASIVILEEQYGSVVSAVSLLSNELDLAQEDIDDLQQEVVDISAEVFQINEELITVNSTLGFIQNELDDLSGVVDNIGIQVEGLEGSISIIQGELSDLSDVVIDLSTNVARKNASNTFTEDNLFTGAKNFVVNIQGSPDSSITFAGREVSIQSSLMCYAGPGTHIDATVTGVLSVNQNGEVDDRTFNYITTPKVEITTEPVDLSDATTKYYVDNVVLDLSGQVRQDLADLSAVVYTNKQDITDLSNVVSNIDFSNLARLDISNTFQGINTFLETIRGENIVANKFLTDNNGEELVYGNYSNTYYVNDNETGPSGSINDTLALVTSGVKIIRISAGTYSENVVVSGKTLVGLSAPVVGNTTATEVNNFTIENSFRIRVAGLQIQGSTVISGDQLRHTFNDCDFNGGLTISGGGLTGEEFLIFEDCDVSTSLDIAGFTGIVYFYRVNFNNASFNLSPLSPQQIFMIDCTGIPTDVSTLTDLSFTPIGLTGYYKSGSITISDIAPNSLVSSTNPSLDNELTSKVYVDTSITGALTNAVYNDIVNIFTQKNTFLDCDMSFTPTQDLNAVNKLYVDTQINDLSAIKQDTIIDLSTNGFLSAGSNISFDTVGSNITINSTGGGGNNHYFLAIPVADVDVTGISIFPFNNLLIGTGLVNGVYTVPEDGIYYFAYVSETPNGVNSISDLRQYRGSTIIASRRTQNNEPITQGSQFFNHSLFEVLTGDLISVRNVQIGTAKSRVSTFASRFLGFKIS